MASHAAIEFLKSYPLGTVFRPGAKTEFDLLPPQEKQGVLKTLWEDPFVSRDFLKGLLPAPSDIATPPPLERMRRLIEQTGREIGNQLPAGDEPLWERRWKVALMLYWLEDWQLGLQEDHQNNPDLKDFEQTHPFLVGTLQTFYRESRPPEASGNPLFDTDRDGVFDDVDSFPLDRWFSQDADQDHLPDEMDPDPNEIDSWPDLQEGEQRVLKGPDGTRFVRVRREQGELIVEIMSRFGFENRSVEKKFRSRWKKARERVETYLREKAGIRIRLVEDRRGQMIAVAGKYPRETSNIWSPNLLQPDQTPNLAHEYLHHLLRWQGVRGDRYQERFQFRYDHVFEPGREVLVPPRDLMRQIGSDSTISPEDLLIPAWLVAGSPSYPNLAKSFLAEGLREERAAYGYLARHTSQPEVKERYLRRMLSKDRQAFRLDPANDLVSQALTATYEQWADATDIPDEQSKFFRRMVESARRSVQLAPRDGYS